MEISNPYIFIFSFLIIAGLIFSTPIFSYIDRNTEKKSKHNVPLDSLRYFLASFVFIAHSIGIYDYVLHGTFRGKYEEINMLAKVGVALFFAITGALFWAKIKKGNTNWVGLYKSRFFRIVPLIWFNSLIICTIIIFITKEEPTRKIYDWFDFINNNRPDFSTLNGTWIFTGGVFWTLVYEWGFYFALPILSLFAKRSFELSAGLAFCLIYIGKTFMPSIPLHYLMFFVIGMLADDISDKITISKVQLNILLSLSIGTLLYFMPYTNDVSSFSNILLFIIIFSVYKGADLFGVLSLRGFQRLGEASYSVYIMHALILYSVMKVAKLYDTLIGNENFIFISCYFLILLASSVTYRFIEKPFINLGKVQYIKSSKSNSLIEK